MKAPGATEFIDDNTLDCMLPQCVGCPLRFMGLEAVPHEYPSEAHAEEQNGGDFTVRSGEMTPSELIALSAAVARKKAGFCQKPEM